MVKSTQCYLLGVDCEREHTDSSLGQLWACHTGTKDAIVCNVTGDHSIIIFLFLDESTLRLFLVNQLLQSPPQHIDIM